MEENSTFPTGQSPKALGKLTERCERTHVYFSVGKICGDLKDQCFQNALALWSIAYKSKPSPELKNKLAVIRELMGHPATECAIKPGYCGSLKELADRWAEDGENIDYADISCFGTGTSGNGGDIGCLPVLFALALIVCLILQFAGLVDVMGILESKLGATGAKAAAGILWFICLWLLIRAGRSRKRG